MDLEVLEKKAIRDEPFTFMSNLRSLAKTLVVQIINEIIIDFFTEQHRNDYGVEFVADGRKMLRFGPSFE